MPSADWSVFDLATWSRPEPSSKSSTFPQVSAEASERRSSPSRITCRRAKSTRARLAASDSVSLRQRLPW